MQEHLKTFLGTVNKGQILIGVGGLLVGTLVYLTDRPPDQTYFIYTSLFTIRLFKILPNLFSHIGNTLPSFIHVFSFIFTLSLVSVGFL